MKTVLSMLVILCAGLASAGTEIITMKLEVFKVEDVEWLEKNSSENCTRIFKGIDWQSKAVRVTEMESQVMIDKKFDVSFESYGKYLPSRYHIESDIPSTDAKAYPQKIWFEPAEGSYISGTFGTSTNLNHINANIELKVRLHQDWMFEIVRVDFGTNSHITVYEYMEEAAASLAAEADRTGVKPRFSSLGISEELEFGNSYVWRTKTRGKPDRYFLKLMVIKSIDGVCESSSEKGSD